MCGFTYVYIIRIYELQRFEYYRYCGCPTCLCVCVSVRSFLPPRASRPRNIGTYVFTATRRTLLYTYYNRDVDMTSLFAILKTLRSDADAYNLILISASYYYAPWP